MGGHWDAVIDMFAARNIPIRTIERASGIIATEPLPGGRRQDLGGLRTEQRLRPLPELRDLQRPGSGRFGEQPLKATVRWTLTTRAAASIECATSHEWERDWKPRPKNARRPARRWPGRVALFGFGGGAEPTSRAAPVHPSLPGCGLRTGPGGAGPGGARAWSSCASPPSPPRSATCSRSRPAGLRGDRPGHAHRPAHRQGIRSLAIRHYLRRLFYAYRYANDLRPDTLLLLTHGGRVVGTYTETGLDKGLALIVGRFSYTFAGRVTTESSNARNGTARST